MCLVHRTAVNEWMNKKVKTQLTLTKQTETSPHVILTLLLNCKLFPDDFPGISPPRHHVHHSFISLFCICECCISACPDTVCVKEVKPFPFDAVDIGESHVKEAFLWESI